MRNHRQDFVGPNPFFEIPKSKFSRRLLIPAAAVAFLSFAGMGLLATSPWVTEIGQGPGNIAFVPEQTPGRRPSQAAPSFEGVLSLDPSFAHLKKTWSYWIQIPDACWSGGAVNQLQAARCTKYWEATGTFAAVAISPLALFCIFWMLSLESLNGFYRRARSAVEKGQPLAGAIVTHPAAALPDLFSWLFCFRTVSVVLPNKQQIKVYMPEYLPKPLPGQKLFVFSGGRALGSRRLVATLYAPHMAVFAGGHK